MEARSSRFLDPGSVPLKRRPEGNFWAKLVQLTKWLIVLAVSGLLLVLFLPVFNDCQGIRTQKEKLEAKIAAEKELNSQLNQNFELLKVNSDYLQRIMRDNLNLGKPGEMIFRFDHYPPSRPPATDPNQNP